MARVAIPVSFQYEQTAYVATSSGGSPTTQVTFMVPAAGTTVTVTNTDTGNPATVYANSTGSSTISTITTDAGGNVPGWVDEGSYKLIAAPSGSFSGDTVFWQAVLGNGTAHIGPGSIGTSQIQNGAITLPLLASSITQALIPTGTVLPWAGPNNLCPTGFLVAKGQVVSQATYSTLYAIVGNYFNVGSPGPGNFCLPDLRQRWPLGLHDFSDGSTGGLLGSTGGQIDHTHSVQLTVPGFTVPGHNFVVTVPGHSHPLSANGGASINISAGILATDQVQLNVATDLSHNTRTYTGYFVQGVTQPQYQRVSSVQTQPTVSLVGATDANPDFTYNGVTSDQTISSVATSPGSTTLNNPKYIVLNHIIKT